MRNLKYRYLSDEFYNDYANYPEIEHKKARPYAVALVHYNGFYFAIPFRSHIHHKNAFFTTPDRTKGLDYSKAVPILKPSYIDNSCFPTAISQEERANLFGKAEVVEKELIKYVEKYKIALSKQHIKANQTFCKFSCLQYFHAEIGIK